MDREMRLQRLIDIKNTMRIKGIFFLIMGVVSALLAIQYILEFPFSIHYWFYMGITLASIIVASYFSYKNNQAYDQICREYGKPEENIDFK